jgi:hypothetical protein
VSESDILEGAALGLAEGSLTSQTSQRHQSPI